MNIDINVSDNTSVNFPTIKHIAINPFTVIFMYGNIKKIQLSKEYGKSGKAIKYLSIYLGQEEVCVFDDYIPKVLSHFTPDTFRDATELFEEYLKAHDGLAPF